MGDLDLGWVSLNLVGFDGVALDMVDVVALGGIDRVALDRVDGDALGWVDGIDGGGVDEVALSTVDVVSLVWVDEVALVWVVLGGVGGVGFGGVGFGGVGTSSIGGVDSCKINNFCVKGKIPSLITKCGLISVFGCIVVLKILSKLFSLVKLKRCVNKLLKL